jgi:cytochrome d ubiquinol oxidase subunit II
MDLPLAFALVAASTIALYVLADGFDLGIGILFPFAPRDRDRDVMMNSIAPFWD